MSSTWKRCKPGDSFGRWAANYASMNREGYIAISRKTFNNLKSPQAVHLYFDAINGRIGVKGTDHRSPDIFPVGKYGRHGGRVIRAFSLMKEFGLTIHNTLTFHNIEIDRDGIMILDLQTATTRKKEK